MEWMQPPDIVMENLDQYLGAKVHRLCSELLHNDRGHSGAKATVGLLVIWELSALWKAKVLPLTHTFGLPSGTRARTIHMAT
jgi:hypothetical protein